MKILALLELADGKTLQELGPYLLQEERAVWHAYKTGTLREMYFQREPLVASLIFEARDEAEVDAHLSSFPLVAEGLLERRLVTLGPWLPVEKLFDHALLED